MAWVYHGISISFYVYRSNLFRIVDRSDRSFLVHIAPETRRGFHRLWVSHDFNWAWIKDDQSPLFIRYNQGFHPILGTPFWSISTRSRQVRLKRENNAWYYEWGEILFEQWLNINSMTLFIPLRHCRDPWTGNHNWRSSIGDAQGATYFSRCSKYLNCMGTTI